jgi:hypothetical protein
LAGFIGLVASSPGVLEELREIVRGLHPTVLAEGGCARR